MSVNSWVEVKLKEMCERITVGHVGSMAGEYQESGIPFLRSLNITPFRLSFDNLKFIDENFHQKLKKSALRPGDVAVVRTGYPGTACVVPESLPKSNCSDLVIVRPGKNLNPYFLAAIFNSTFGKDLVGGNLVGAAQQHFNITVAKELKLRFPPKPVQDKIAAVLSTYDDLIENNRRRIELLEQMAEELYREWFVRFRFPGWQQAVFEKGIPKVWELGSLGCIASFVMGQSPSSEFYNETGNGHPFHQGVGTYGHRFPKKITYCSVPGRMARERDILFSVRAPVGRLNIADVDLIIGRGIAAVRHKKDLNSYLFYLLKSYFADEDIIGNGSIFNSVSKNELSRFPILIPDIDLVEQFNAFARNIDTQIAALLGAIEKLADVRRQLLTRLISGKLPVDQLDIQFPPSMREAAEAGQEVAHA